MVANMLILVWLYIYCYSGQTVTSNSIEMLDVAYNSLFYMYPKKLQYYLILIMARSQSPFYIRGYKMMNCTLENFSKVRKIYEKYTGDGIINTFFLTANKYVDINLYGFQKIPKPLSEVCFNKVHHFLIKMHPKCCNNSLFVGHRSGILNSSTSEKKLIICGVFV